MSEFDEYIVHGEPGQREKADAWQTAIGLQDVDGLKVSDYLLDTARCIETNSGMTQKNMAATIGKSERTVKSITSALVEKGILTRKCE